MANDTACKLAGKYEATAVDGHDDVWRFSNSHEAQRFQAESKLAGINVWVSLDVAGVEAVTRKPYSPPAIVGEYELKPGTTVDDCVAEWPNVYW